MTRLIRTSLGGPWGYQGSGQRSMEDYSTGIQQGVQKLPKWEVMPPDYPSNFKKCLTLMGLRIVYCRICAIVMGFAISYLLV